MTAGTDGAEGPGGASAASEIDLPDDLRADIRNLARSLTELDYYEVLGVPRDVDADALRDAFFQCSKKYHQDRYHNDRGYKKNMQEKKAVYRNSIRQFIWSYLSEHPCVDCGETDIDLLEFDHVRGTKIFSIGNRQNRAGLPTIKKEIAKCDVRCANCHRKVTLSRAGYNKKLA